MKKPWLLPFSLLAFFAMLVSSPLEAFAQKEELKALELTLNALGNAGRFSGVVRIEQAGQTLFKGEYGQKAPGSPDKPGQDNLFDVGGLSRQLTAAAVLKLVERGRLDLDASISRWVPAKDEKAKITIRHLLSQRSGLGVPSDYLSWDLETRQDPSRFFVRYIETAPLEGRPGGAFADCRFCYNLLAWIVEVQSGKAYEDYVREQLLRPLGLKNSGLNDAKSTDPALATTGQILGSGTHSAGQIVMDWSEKGATGFVTSAEEMSLWAQAVFEGRVLSPSQMAEWITPVAAANGEDPVPSAFGWFVGTDEKGSPRFLSYAGSAPGFVGHLFIDLRTRTTLISLSNQAESSMLIDLAQLLLEPSLKNPTPTIEDTTPPPAAITPPEDQSSLLDSP